jgi:hypothetical protein
VTDQVVGADLTVPAGTPIAAPATLVVQNGPGWISLVRLTIPAGHNGLTGWALSLAGTLVIPYAGQSWVTGNDLHLEWPLNRWYNDGQLVVRAYNLGVFAHTFPCLLDWDAAEPGLSVEASIAANSPTGPTAAAAVSGLTGYGPDDMAAATAAAGSS